LQWTAGAAENHVWLAGWICLLESSKQANEVAFIRWCCRCGCARCMCVFKQLVMYPLCMLLLCVLLCVTCVVLWFPIRYMHARGACLQRGLAPQGRPSIHVRRAIATNVFNVCSTKVPADIECLLLCCQRCVQSIKRPTGPTKPRTAASRPINKCMGNMHCCR
jgi:hypothetical protein